MEAQVPCERWRCECALWCQGKHAGTAEASSECELLGINVETFCKTLQAKQVLNPITGKYGRQSHRTLACAYPPLAGRPPTRETPSSPLRRSKLAEVAVD